MALLFRLPSNTFTGCALRRIRIAIPRGQEQRGTGPAQYSWLQNEAPPVQVKAWGACGTNQGSLPRHFIHTLKREWRTYVAFICFWCPRDSIHAALPSRTFVASREVFCRKAAGISGIFRPHAPSVDHLQISCAECRGNSPSSKLRAETLGGKLAQQVAPEVCQNRELDPTHTHTPVYSCVLRLPCLGWFSGTPKVDHLFWGSPCSNAAGTGAGASGVHCAPAAPGGSPAFGGAAFSASASAAGASAAGTSEIAGGHGRLQRLHHSALLLETQAVPLAICGVCGVPSMWRVRPLRFFLVTWTKKRASTQ